MPAAAIGYDEWLQELQKAHAEPDPAREGWLTATQLARAWRKPAPTVGRLLRDLLAAGLWERKSFRVQTEGRGVYPTPHYRPVRKGKSR